MYECKAYGLVVVSDFCLLESGSAIAETKGEPDVVVKIGSHEDTSKDCLEANPVFEGCLPQIGRFWIQKNRITVQPCDGLTDQALSACVLGTAFSVLLRQRGFLVLHASAVIVQDKAIAFIGSSGAGKSTTASAFLREGYPVITDDVLAIRLKDGQAEVVPSYPVIKLLPDAVEALGHAEKLPFLYPSSLKRIQMFDDETLQDVYSLHRVYLLSKGDHHEIQPLSPTEGLLTLINQSRGAKALIGSNSQKLHFKQCAELAKLQMTFRLRRRPGLESLSEIVGLVEDDLTHGKAPTHIPQVGIVDSPIHNA